MFLAFFLTCNWGNFIRWKFPLINSQLKLIICVQLLILFYGIIELTIDEHYLFFILYVIAYVLALSTNNTETSLGKLPKYMFSLSLIPLVLGVFVCSKNLVVGDEVWSLKKEITDYALEPFTVSQGALTNMIAGLCMSKTTKWEKLLFLMSLLAGSYVILSCGKRTPYIVFFATIIYYLYVKSRKNINNIVKYLLTLTLFMFFTYLIVPFFQEKIDGFFYNSYNGLLNLLGDTSVTDETGSALMRVYSRERAYQYISNNFGFINYIFGGGYSCIGQIDNPLLQIFVEMGLLGTFLYMYIVVLIPFKIARLRINNNTLILVLVSSFYPIVSIFNSGNPYMWTKWAPVATLIAISSAYILKNRNGRKK